MIVDWICLGLMVALVVDVFLGVFSRYVLHATFQWYDEVARLCFVWMVFLGAAVAVRRGAHFRLHLLIDRFGPRLRHPADLAGVSDPLGSRPRGVHRPEPAATLR